MDLEKFQFEIMQIYYGESSKTLKEARELYSVPSELAENEWRQLAMVSKRFNALPEYQPSQMSLNKIMAHANERAESLVKRPFWQWLWRPSYALSVLVVAGVIGGFSWQHVPDTDKKMVVAQNQVVTSPIADNGTAYHSVIKRLFATPFDRDVYDPTYSLPQKSSRYLNSLVSSVSAGNSAVDENSFFADDDIDQKMLASPATPGELDTLFFRARKFEKLGYFQEALHDYLFISKNYPEFAFQKTMPISIARCYEQLGDKKTAALVLDSYQKSYGKNDDINLWIDQLKSETL